LKQKEPAAPPAGWEPDYKKNDKLRQWYQYNEKDSITVRKIQNSCITR
jgi:hypothetical protein